jgi:hypothetical protein
MRPDTNMQVPACWGTFRLRWNRKYNCLPHPEEEPEFLIGQLEGYEETQLSLEAWLQKLKQDKVVLAKDRIGVRQSHRVCPLPNDEGILIGELWYSKNGLEGRVFYGYRPVPFEDVIGIPSSLKYPQVNGYYALYGGRNEYKPVVQYDLEVVWPILLEMTAGLRDEVDTYIKSKNKG